MDPFNNGGGRQADSASQLGKRYAGVGLKLGQNLTIDIVNRRVNQYSQDGRLFVISRVTQLSLNNEVNCPLGGYLLA